MSAVVTQALALPPISEREVLRYMGAREATDAVRAMLREVIDEAGNCFSGRVCAMECPVSIDGATVDLGFSLVESRDLAKALAGCASAILFAATVGMEIDRLIARYQHLSPARALALQALGAERVEALCDVFCRARAAEYEPRGLSLRPRFSAGYGDLPLSFQRELFRALDCPKRIGLTLNDSLLMSPTKSVTAIVGLKKG